MPLFCCFNRERVASNARCEVCKKTAIPPNILGKFVVLENDKTNIICTGCKTVLEKKKTIITFV